MNSTSINDLNRYKEKDIISIELFYDEKKGKFM